MQVEADALRRNYARIREAVGPEVRMLPMVKANAYGLGMTGVVARIEPLEPWGYGVAAVAEGLSLRAAGVSRPIVVCSPAPVEVFEAAVTADLQLSVSDLTALEALERASSAAGRTASWHLDVDTGMGRSGFDWRRAEEWLPAATRPRPGLRWAGVYTHLHSADEGTSTVHEQWERLTAVLDRVANPPEGLMIHVLNSAGSFRTPEYARSVVRPGIFLYGGGVGPDQPEPEPVASVHARVVHLRDAEAGTTLGYGSTYTATECRAVGHGVDRVRGRSAAIAVEPASRAGRTGCGCRSSGGSPWTSPW